VITHSGIWVTPTTGLVPSPLDIAVHSGRITRYAGALWSPLLAHMVFVAEITWSELMMRTGPGGCPNFDYPTWAWSLLHDAHETFMGEIPRRWKLPERKAQEKEADRRIAAAYGLLGSVIDHALIKEADERALLAEAVTLKLPGFPEKYTAENNLLAFPDPPGGDLEMMEALVRSGFYQIEQCTNPASPAVVGIARVLTFIQGGHLADALFAFREILNEVLPEVKA
jgi:hypothetical protein